MTTRLQGVITLGDVLLAITRRCLEDQAAGRMGPMPSAAALLQQAEAELFEARARMATASAHPFQPTTQETYQ